MPKRLFIIITDNLGLGGANATGQRSIEAIEATGKLRIPNLRELGFDRLLGLDSPAAGCCGRIGRQNPGNGMMSALWELCGIKTDYAPPTYPAGFPEKQANDIENFTHRRVLGNVCCTAAEALANFGKEHLRGGGPIIFTTGQSVMYIAAHISVMDANRLQEICEYARRVMHGQNSVGRVVALPFDGYGEDFRFVEGFAEYTVPPPDYTVTEIISKRWMEVVGIGRAYPLLAGRGFSKTIRPVGDRKSLEALVEAAEGDFTGLCMTVLSQVDEVFINATPENHAHAMTDLDYAIGRLRNVLRRDDAVILLSGFNNSEQGDADLPLLAFGPGIRRGVDIGARQTLADISAFAIDFFEMPHELGGTSFYPQVEAGD